MREYGFTLPKVLIMVAGIGLLAGVGIPTWQAYVMRGQVEQGVELAAESRDSIEKYFTSTGRLPRHGGEAGLKMERHDAQLEYVTWRRDPRNPESIGYLDVQMNLQPLGSGITPIVLEARIAGNRLEWRCISARQHGIPPENSVSDHYLPAACRQGETLGP